MFKNLIFVMLNIVAGIAYCMEQEPEKQLSLHVLVKNISEDCSIFMSSATLRPGDHTDLGELNYNVSEQAQEQIDAFLKFRFAIVAIAEQKKISHDYRMLSELVKNDLKQFLMPTILLEHFGKNLLFGILPMLLGEKLELKYDVQWLTHEETEQMNAELRKKVRERTIREMQPAAEQVVVMEAEEKRKTEEKYAQWYRPVILVKNQTRAELVLHYKNREGQELSEILQVNCVANLGPFSEFGSFISVDKEWQATGKNKISQTGWITQEEFSKQIKMPASIFGQDIIINFLENEPKITISFDKDAQHVLVTNISENLELNVISKNFIFKMGSLPFVGVTKAYILQNKGNLDIGRLDYFCVRTSERGREVVHILPQSLEIFVPGNEQARKNKQDSLYGGQASKCIALLKRANAEQEANLGKHFVIFAKFDVPNKNASLDGLWFTPEKLMLATQKPNEWEKVLELTKAATIAQKYQRRLAAQEKFVGLSVVEQERKAREEEARIEQEKKEKLRETRLQKLLGISTKAREQLFSKPKLQKFFVESKEELEKIQSEEQSKETQRIAQEQGGVWNTLSNIFSPIQTFFVDLFNAIWEFFSPTPEPKIIK